MVMSSDGPPTGPPATWLPDPVSIGFLATAFPSDLVDAVVDEAGARERRYRTLPARFMVYYVLALSLFAPKGYVEVMCLLTRSLSWLRDEPWPGKSATVPAIAKARYRLGEAPLALLFSRVAGPLAAPGTGGAFWRGFRLVSVDEIAFELPDTAENTAAFGRPAPPEARVVTLGESRTGALLGAAFGTAAHPGTPLVSGVVRHLGETTVLLAGERFPVGALWHDAMARGAQLVWQVAAPVTLPVTEVLADGSCLVQLPGTWARNSRDAVVRMIECEYRTASGRPAGAAFALLTTLTDPAEAPADEILACHEARWRGSAIAHTLTGQHGPAGQHGLHGPADQDEPASRHRPASQHRPRMTLRSRSPDMARQEIWAMLCLYQRARDLTWHASRALRLHDGLPVTPRLVRVRRHAEPLTAAPAAS